VARFLIDRLLQATFVLLAMSFVVYLLIWLMPGDPLDLQLAADPNMTPESAAILRRVYGLDRPLWDRYLDWLARAVQLDFGPSRLFKVPAMEILVPRLGNTLILLGTALTLAMLIGVPLGVYAARHPHSRIDNAINLLCFAGISMPPFWMALLFILLFAVTLGWLPASGMHPVGQPGLLDRIPFLVMPVMVLTLLNLGAYTRYTRASMLTALRADYVRTARAKGVPERTIVWRHALRNAVIPVVTVIALEFGALFSGALITETMFAYQGMGKMIYDAISGNDYNLALVGLLVATFTVLLASFLADVAYVLLDPRITFGEQRT
jgi:peptide/nickel transport system permease protein